MRWSSVRAVTAGLLFTIVVTTIVDLALPRCWAGGRIHAATSGSRPD